MTFALIAKASSALSTIAPLPSAVTALLTVRPPDTTSMLMLPLPPSVCTPPVPIIRMLVSCMTMSPLVLFVATSVPIVVSMSPAPLAPIPVAAVRVTVPVVEILAVSTTAPVISVIAPPVAVTLIAREVFVIWPSKTFVPASNVTAPLPVE